MTDTGDQGTQVEAEEPVKRGITRRRLMIGGGIGIGLVAAWAIWPRQYEPDLPVAAGEYQFGPWLKISEDGQVIVAIPQSEMGQGVYTQLALVVASELGADWRTVAIQPAAPNPLYYNRFLAREWAGSFVGDDLDSDAIPENIVDEIAQRENFVLTAGSSSLLQFEQPCRQAGAAARVMLCKAAAAQWNIAWEECEAKDGIVSSGKKSMTFAQLARDAALMDLPDPIPLRPDYNPASSEESPLRLDATAKVDGSATFAGDIRLPDMLYASVRAGPIGDTSLKAIERKNAPNKAGLVTVFKTKRWVAALGSNWWAANSALDKMTPTYETRGEMANSSDMVAAMEKRIERDGWIIHNDGNYAAAAAENKKGVFKASYTIAPALHAPLETRSATAQMKDGRLQLWLATQAPEAAKAAAAKAIGLSVDDVALFPMMAGGSFGRNMDCEIASQAAILTKHAKRPVQVVWSRPEDFMRDYPRAPAVVRMDAVLEETGMIAGYYARFSTPATMREQALRLRGISETEARRDGQGEMDRIAVEGAFPPYSISNLKIAHFPAQISLPTGRFRGNGHNITAFARECFIDELARKSGIEPLSYRMQMLLDETRLARCLTQVAALANWDGGDARSGKGLACHVMRGGYIALVAQAAPDDGGIVVREITAVVDAGRLVHRDIARQQIEGGIIFGIAQALGASTEYDGGLPVAKRLRDMDLPRLSEIPEITVEFIESTEEPAGLGELSVPVVAPALANALHSASGIRIREMPLISRGL